MRCPGCKYITFDYLDVCPKCGADLSQLGAKFFQFRGEPQYSVWMWLQVPAVESDRPEPSVAETEVGEAEEVMLVVDEDLIGVVPVEEEGSSPQGGEIAEVGGISFETPELEMRQEISDEVVKLRGDVGREGYEAVEDEELERLLSRLEEGDEELGEIFESLESEEVSTSKAGSPESGGKEKVKGDLDIEIPDVEDLEVDFEDIEVVEEEDQEKDRKN